MNSIGPKISHLGTKSSEKGHREFARLPKNQEEQPLPKTIPNPLRGQILDLGVPLPCDDARGVETLLGRCPAYRQTPLVQVPQLAARTGVAEVWVKDESNRMGLGSFKALGAAFAIAREASTLGNAGPSALSGRTYVTASAGNHGLSVAAGAALFGARAVIYLSKTVPHAFAERLRAKGAEVVIQGETYEDSMAAAMEAASVQGWTLLSDSSWQGYLEMPYRVMEGYLMLAEETVRQMSVPPTHILLQAGVGGLAASAAALFRKAWGDAPVMIVVEPEYAPAIQQSLVAGRAVDTAGPVSNMGRLDCKTPSLIALAGLARDADLACTITEDEATEGVRVLAELGFETTPSGGAGLAALIAGLDLSPDARVLTIVSEGAA